MNKKQTTESELTATVDGLKQSYIASETSAAGPGFKPGHARIGGRKQGSQNKRTRQAIEICESYDFHPVATLITVITTGKLPNADGTFAEVDTPGRLDALKSLCPYVMPRLQSTQVTGKDDGPIEVENGFDINVLMADPASIELAQALALKLAGCKEPIRTPKLLEAGQQDNDV